MKLKGENLIAAGVEAGIFLGLGILLIGIVSQDITRFFVVHRLRPFIAGTGIVFLLWGIQNLAVLTSSDKRKHTFLLVHHNSGYYFQRGIFVLLLFFVSIAVFQYRNSGKPRNTVQIQDDAGFSSGVTQAQLNSQVQRYSDVQMQAIESEQSDASFSAVQGATVRQPVPHTFTTASGQMLGGYYPDKKQIVISDTEGAGWVKEIEDHAALYTGWSVTMKGCVVTDPSVFSPSMFCPSRELMTCCVADLSLIGFTCLYDTRGPFAYLIHDGTWITVTGILKEGEFEGKTEPQLICTSVKKSSIPDDLYLYP
jgi:uncharacterized repeat protein (TIGR03943 family)